jgi:hypothetical protein
MEIKKKKMKEHGNMVARGSVVVTAPCCSQKVTGSNSDEVNGFLLIHLRQTEATRHHAHQNVLAVRTPV